MQSTCSVDDRDEAFSLATRIVVMERGVIEKIGAAEEISRFLSELFK
jgi:ABC-type Fe3+/spermidine/putrescine transport system ATPase subunit